MQMLYSVDRRVLYRRSRTLANIGFTLLFCTACAATDPYDPFDTPEVDTLDRSATYFDCESNPGRFSLTKQPLHGPIASISGVVRINHERPYPGTAPGLTFALRDQWGEILIGAALADLQVDGNPVGQVLSIRRGAINRENTNSTYRVLEAVEIAISVSADQSLGTVRIGNDIVTNVPIYGQPTSLTMVCNSSWSELNFDEVEYHQDEGATDGD